MIYYYINNIKKRTVVDYVWRYIENEPQAPIEKNSNTKQHLYKTHVKKNINIPKKIDIYFAVLHELKESEYPNSVKYKTFKHIDLKVKEICSDTNFYKYDDRPIEFFYRKSFLFSKSFNKHYDCVGGLSKSGELNWLHATQFYHDASNDPGGSRYIELRPPEILPYERSINDDIKEGKIKIKISGEEYRSKDLVGCSGKACILEFKLH